jgi:hypothetical protein
MHLLRHPQRHPHQRNFWKIIVRSFLNTNPEAQSVFLVKKCQRFLSDAKLRKKSLKLVGKQIFLNKFIIFMMQKILHIMVILSLHPIGERK